jgi:hypothetical protein
MSRLVSHGWPRQVAVRHLRARLEGVHFPVWRPSEYDAWIRNHFDIHDEEIRFGKSHLCFRCPEKSCLHYIYGFPTHKALGEHLKEHENGTSLPSLSISQEDHMTQNDTPITHGDGLDESTIDADFVYVSFDSGST